jgi:hypothetical protein
MKKKVFYWLAGIVALQQQKQAELDVINAKRAAFEKQFSGWSGAHIKTERFIKQNLKDPDSYDHVSTRYKVNNEDTLIILTTYRAKNSFGATILETTKVLVSSENGDVIRIVK